MAVTLKLRAPIEAHGQTLHVLELRDPNTDDAIEVDKMPYTLNEKGRVQPLPGVAAQYLSRMAAVPPSSIAQLHLADFNDAAWIVANFFWQPAAVK